jgi:hypothetical protein
MSAIEAKAKASSKRKHGQLSETGLSILDCPICMDTFNGPIFQCKEGHTICKSCKSKLPQSAGRKKCPSCKGTLGNIRCRALETMIENMSCHVRTKAATLLAKAQSSKHTNRNANIGRTSVLVAQTTLSVARVPAFVIGKVHWRMWWST